MSSNPFASLLGDSAAEPKLLNKADELNEERPSTASTDGDLLSTTLESIFQITLNPAFQSSSKCKYSIFLGDSSSTEHVRLSFENLDELLLQRIMTSDRSELLERLRPLTDPDDPVIKQITCLELRSFNYLYRCFKRLLVSDLSSDQKATCSSLIVNLCRTLLNIFDSDEVNVSVIQKAVSDKFRSSQPSQTDHDYTNAGVAEEFIRESFQLKDLSVQLLYLALDSFGLTSASSSKTSDSETFEKFYDQFIELFEDCKATQSYYDSVEKNETTVLDNGFLESLELKFLANIFVYLDKFVVSASDCEFFSVKYTAYFGLIKALTKSKLMKYLFVSSSFPAKEDLQNGRAWQEKTLIGKLLSPHSLPLAQLKQSAAMPNNNMQANFLLNRLGMNREYRVEFLFFTSPSTLTKRDVEIYEQNIWDRLKTVQLEQAKFFYEHLVKTNSNKLVRSLMLKWFGMCMFANKAKGQEWSNYMHPTMAMFSGSNLGRFGSDGFFLNMLAVLLQYSLPFARKANSPLLLKIDSRYGLSVNKDPYNLVSIAGPHFIGFDKETKMLAAAESSAAASSSRDDVIDFNFITECFYATHQCFQLAFISVYQKLMKINNDISRWQQTYQQLMESHGQGDPQVESLKRNYESMSTEFLNIKAALLHEELLSKLIGFICSSSSWLAHLATDNEEKSQVKPVADLSQLAKPSAQSGLEMLRMTPEFFVTNAVELFIFLSRFKDSNLDNLLLQDNDDANLNAFFSLVLVFMGSPERLFNPHLRAQLAEAVEAIIPRKAQDSGSLSSGSRKRLSLATFVKHPCSAYFCEALLNVFVSIEMTGQSVQFEQKFNYRRPMYELLEFLWFLPDSFANEPSQNKSQLSKHRLKLKELADEAFANIDNSEQPLFLKFLNFLINDANYLLLEGLLYLEKIKSSQDKLERDAFIRSQSQPEEPPLTNEQRNEIEKNLKHMIMIAKFHNYMSLKTIQTIKQLTSEIQEIFCHEVLVDRVAVMLNDFLLHLVGPKKRKQLKVKDFKEVEFKPQEMVATICDIYLNLGVKEQFCQAVCRDGRSYSPELFPLAEDVLSKIGRDFEMIESFKQLGKKIEDLLAQQRSEENAFEDAPDEYLDPIMSHLMVDPVMLPSSKKIVDRSTIARHLLSDQTDPFNRSPLTLPEVVPASDLKQEIEAWKASKRLAMKQ